MTERKYRPRNRRSRLLGDVSTATALNRTVALTAEASRGMSMMHFEDLDVVMVPWGNEVRVDRDEMLALAQRFDPQRAHLTDSAAQAIGLDEVIVSGSFTWALIALSMHGTVRERVALRPRGPA